MLPFGRVLLLLVGDLLQLPPFNQKSVFMKPSKGSYKSFNGWLRETFQLHELVEIVQQSSDPDFAHLLQRVREGQLTNDDLTQIKASANTETTTWSDEFVKFYLNNYLAGKINDSSIRTIDSEIIFKAQAY